MECASSTPMFLCEERFKIDVVVVHAPGRVGGSLVFRKLIWERNNRVFQNSDHPVSRVAALIKDQVQTFALAREQTMATED
jgi:hypothetical protein